MPTPKNKKELIEFSSKNYELLMEKIKELPKEELIKPRQKGKSIKDHLAHLYAWQLMMETWYKNGMKNIKIEMPAPGYTWKEIPKLNKKIDQEYKKTPLKEILKNLNKSHKKMLTIMNKHSNKELFTKKLYPWTGSSSLAIYLRGATSSHYNWAIKRIKKDLKKISHS